MCSLGLIVSLWCFGVCRYTTSWKTVCRLRYHMTATRTVDVGKEQNNGAVELQSSSTDEC